MTSLTHEAMSDGQGSAVTGQTGILAVHLRAWWPFWVVVALAMIPILYVPVQTGSRFLSDDTAMYWAARNFAETGKLYVEDDLTRADEENLIHVRGFVTHEGRAVPYNFLGMPVLYGAAYAVVGEHAEYLGAILAVVALASIWGMLGIWQGSGRRWSFGLIALAFPMLYYFGRPYMNVVPSLSFFLLGLYLLMRYYQRPSWQRLVLSAVAFSVGVFCRYPDALIVAPLVAIVLLQRHGSMFSRTYLGHLAIFAITCGVVFGIPLLVLNWMTYGSPLTYGYDLFNEAYYPNRGGSDAGGMTGMINTAGVWLLPGGVDFELLGESLRKYFALLVPVVPVLAVLGYIELWKSKRAPRRFLVAYLLLVLYVLLYAGSGRVWGTQFDEPTLGHTMVRYWLLVYLAFALGASYVLLKSREALPRLGILGVAVAFAAVGLFQGEDSLPSVKAGIDRGVVWSDTYLLPRVEDDAVVYAGRSDKFVVPVRRVAAWYNSADETFYEPGLVSASMNRVFRSGHPVYVVNEPEVEMDKLQESLAVYGLYADRVGKGVLYRVTDVAPASAKKETGR